jgi:hypothetical protein
MRLAWFRPATHLSERLDDTGALIHALSTAHEIEPFDEARAHDFIRLDFRAPFDLCVFDLADTAQHAFIWPYLMHVPGVLRLRNLSLHESRTQALRRRHREHDRGAELALGDWHLAAAPIWASRLTVVSDAHAAASLQRAYPVANIRYAPVGLPGNQRSGRTGGQTQGQPPGRTTIVGALDRSRSGVVQRAFARAREAGAQLELMAGPPELILDTADVVIAITWPPADEVTMALAGMAAARAVVVLETEGTAGWPALDPQTWLSRGWSTKPPVVISVDPRDEEHSLSLALRRLANDAALLDSVSSAAHQWWQQHATLDHAVHAWRSLIAEAVTLTAPPRPANFPHHLTADGTERARDLLAEFGATVDFL